MVDHDIDTVSTMLEGTQLRNLDNGTITTFNRDGSVYHQAEYGNIVNPGEGIHYDFKIQKDENIDHGEESKLQDVIENIY